MLPDIHNFFRKLFRGKKASSPVREIAGSGIRPEKRAELEKLCEQLFKKKELMTSGKFQLIGLAKIKKRMGKQWAGLSKIVYSTTEDVIKKYIGKGDIFIRYHDDTYIIIFAHAGLEEGQRIAALIAAEIQRRLFELGEEELRHLEIRGMASELRAGFLTDFLDEFAVDFEEPFPSPPEDLPAAKQDSSPATINPLEVNAASRRPVAQQAKAVAVEDIKCSYLPLWDVRRGALTTYLCLARERGTPGDLMSMHKALFQGAAPEHKEALDLKILETVMAELVAMEKSERKFLVACPVQHETLHRFESYERYKAVLQRIPATQIQYLVFYMMNMDERLPLKDPYWFAAPLRQFCRHVFAEVPLRRDINFNYLRNTGVDAAGVRIESSETPEQELINLMTAFSAKAKSLKIPMTFVLGVSSLSLTTATVCAGFDFIGGSAVHDEVARPESVHKYRHEDLIAELIGKEKT